MTGKALSTAYRDRSIIMTTTDQIKELRSQTGVGIGDCKSALERSNGDLDKAKLLLREEGKKLTAGTVAGEGTIGRYLHHNGQIAALVEVNCQTDFTARNAEFKDFANKIAMHVASANPKYVSRDKVPADEVEKEEAFLAEQAKASGRPEHIIATKIIPGQMRRFYAEQCLLDQPFVMDEKNTVGDLLNDLAAKVGETVAIKRITRFQVGN
jgi:elongation factor Ts